MPPGERSKLHQLIGNQVRAKLEECKRARLDAATPAGVIDTIPDASLRWRLATLSPDEVAALVEEHREAFEKTGQERLKELAEGYPGITTLRAKGPGNV